MGAAEYLMRFIDSPVIGGDKILSRLLRQADAVDDVALVIHDFTRQTNEYIGSAFAEWTGYRIEDFHRLGMKMLIDKCDPEDLKQLNWAVASYIHQAQRQDFDPKDLIIQKYHWTFIHRDGSRLPVASLGIVLTYTRQRDMQFGVGFFISERAQQNRARRCTQLLRMIKRRHNQIYSHPPFIPRSGTYQINLTSGPDLITSRERQVLTLLAKGKSTTEVGSVLGITSNTVESHRRNLLRKFDSKNSAELVKKASKLYWFE